MLQTGLIVTLLLLSAGNVITVMFLEMMPWIAACGHLGALFICYLLMFHYLRFKRKDSILGLVGQLQLDDEGPMVSLGDISRGMLQQNGLEWAQSPLPFPRDRAVEIVPEVVIVELPDESNTMGLPMMVYLRSEPIDPDFQVNKTYELDPAESYSVADENDVDIIIADRDMTMVDEPELIAECSSENSVRSASSVYLQVD
jgi:hypothetical protein